MTMKAATIPQPLTQSRHLATTQSQPPFRAIARPLIDIVVPVLNEEKILQKSITTLDGYMAKHLPYRYQITIADNGSQDKTLEIAKNLAKKHQSVRVLSLAEHGHGRALKQAWRNSPADILMICLLVRIRLVKAHKHQQRRLITAQCKIAKLRRHHRLAQPPTPHHRPINRW